MILNFGELLQAIHNEISPEHELNAMRWIDENMDGAWSNAVDRFDRALEDAQRTTNFEHAKREGEVYRDTCISLLREYKRRKGIDQRREFLRSLSSQVKAMREGA